MPTFLVVVSLSTIVCHETKKKLPVWPKAFLVLISMGLPRRSSECDHSSRLLYMQPWLLWLYLECDSLSRNKKMLPVWPKVFLVLISMELPTGTLEYVITPACTSLPQPVCFYWEHVSLSWNEKILPGWPKVYSVLISMELPMGTLECVITLAPNMSSITIFITTLLCWAQPVCFYLECDSHEAKKGCQGGPGYFLY